MRRPYATDLERILWEAIRGRVSDLGLRPIINACGPATRVGGHRMHPEVVAAIAEAAQSSFRDRRAPGTRGRDHRGGTGAEAGFVSAGASSGLTLAAAAVLAGVDPVRIDRCPTPTACRTRSSSRPGHRNAYDHALRAAGARLVDVGTQGYPGGGRTHPWQIEAAIGPRTVAIAHPFQNAPGRAAARRSWRSRTATMLAVIVDAAAALPPKENLRRFIAEGADLVAYSRRQGDRRAAGQRHPVRPGRPDPRRRPPAAGHGRGPAHVALPLDDRAARSPGPPHHGIGRSMKVGKEQIVGLLVALQRFIAADEPAEAGAPGAPARPDAPRSCRRANGRRRLADRRCFAGRLSTAGSRSRARAWTSAARRRRIAAAAASRVLAGRRSAGLRR